MIGRRVYEVVEARPVPRAAAERMKVRSSAGGLQALCLHAVRHDEPALRTGCLDAVLVQTERSHQVVLGSWAVHQRAVAALNEEAMRRPVGRGTPVDRPVTLDRNEVEFGVGTAVCAFSLNVECVAVEDEGEPGVARVEPVRDEVLREAGQAVGLRAASAHRLVEVADPHIARRSCQQFFDGVTEMTGMDEMTIAGPYLCVGRGAPSGSRGGQEDAAIRVAAGRSSSPTLP